jgi:alkanesulfonate monooxygenase SsuD/methylene tetrahydromethanopterin reductase-like flavin-dependent oxidoreductase (luciferase family)
MAGFDVAAGMPLVIGDDLQAVAAPIRAYASLYVGGMGSRDVNFYNQLACRMGYEDAAAEIQTKYMSRDYEGAAAAVPFEFIDSTSLIGPKSRIAERMAAFARAGVTTLNVMPLAATLEERLNSLRIAADALAESGAAE